MGLSLIAAFTLLTTSVVHTIVGGIVLTNNFHHRTNKTFFLLSLSLALWTFFYAICYTTQSEEQTLFWTRILTIPTFFYPSLFLYLSLIFPENSYKLSLQFIFYHAIFIIYFFSSLFSNDYIYYAKLVPEGIYFNFGYVYPILGFYIVSTMLYSCYLLLKKFFNLPRKYKSQILYVLVGALLSILMGTIFGVLLPLYNMPQFNFFAPAGTVFVLIFWSFAILKHHILDIKIFISKSLAWTITISILIISWFFVTIIFTSFISNKISTTFLFYATPYLIFSSYYFEKLRLFIQTSSDKVFLKGKYEFKSALSYFVQNLFKAVSLNDLKNIFSNARIDIIESTILELILMDNYQPNDLLPQQVINILQNEKRIVFSNEIKNVPLNKNIEFFVPSFLQDKLLAVIVVGKKLSEDPFKDDEIELFKVLAPQIAIVIERIKPYEQVKVEYEKNFGRLFQCYNFI